MKAKNEICRLTFKALNKQRRNSAKCRKLFLPSFFCFKNSKTAKQTEQLQMRQLIMSCLSGSTLFADLAVFNFGTLSVK